MKRLFLLFSVCFIFVTHGYSQPEYDGKLIGKFTMSGKWEQSVYCLDPESSNFTIYIQTIGLAYFAPDPWLVIKSDKLKNFINILETMKTRLQYWSERKERLKLIWEDPEKYLMYAPGLESFYFSVSDIDVKWYQSSDSYEYAENAVKNAYVYVDDSKPLRVQLDGENIISKSNSKTSFFLGFVSVEEIDQLLNILKPYNK